MNWYVPSENTTRLFLFIWILVLALYALFAISVGGRDVSVSLVAAKFCEDNPIAAFAIGMVMGHIIWRI